MLTADSKALSAVGYRVCAWFATAAAFRIAAS
jgi:hypothetical protein